LPAKYWATSAQVVFAVGRRGGVRNSPAAVDALVTANLPLVGYHVSELLGRVPSYVSRDDLTSAGSLALVLAAQAYDPDTGVPFARYAALRIRGALLDELRSMDWASRGARQRARRVSTVSDELTSKLGRTPTREELASALGTGVAEVDAARGDAERRVLSIEAYDSAIADTVTEPGIGPEENVLVNEKMQHLHAAVKALPERLRYVVEQLFFHDRPVVELAEELGVTVDPPCLAPFTFASHAYEAFHLLMPLYVCRVWEGDPRAREGQELRWVQARGLRELAMPEADRPLVPFLEELL
jgi:RNA polymerase sigma factor (sigma-70 family)